MVNTVKCFGAEIQKYPLDRAIRKSLVNVAKGFQYNEVGGCGPRYQRLENEGRETASVGKSSKSMGYGQEGWSGD